MKGLHFYDQTSLIQYDVNVYEKTEKVAVEEINLLDNVQLTQWLNTYGITHHSDFKKVIDQNKLDGFLNKLLQEDETNKVIELDELVFVAINILVTERDSFSSEQMFFIISNNFVWSIQEKLGDYFNGIRDRLVANKGMLRKQKADYLFFLILESIIDNYEETFLQLTGDNDLLFEGKEIKTTTEFTSLVESRKQEIFKFQKAARALRNAVTKLEQIEEVDLKHKYFSEIKEQTNHLLSDVEFELQQLESKINLIYSAQAHRLNEVMKTLTIFSVIFIPLTFLAGVYGMNFENMPELKFENGYYITLGSMLIISILVLWYFKKKKWF